MIYTDTGRYAIRAVIYLAAQPDLTEPVAVSEIAKAEDIPPFYLPKVMKDLVAAGILHSLRGRGGGFKLARVPEEITALELLEAAENIGRRSRGCALGLDECTDEFPCALHAIWTDFRDALMQTLDSLTVAEMVRELGLKRHARLDAPID